MTTKGQTRWIDHYNALAKRQYSEPEGPMRSALSKLEAATARFALILQLASDPHSPKVSREAVDSAISIALWFEGQARRVYTDFAETAIERQRSEVLRWIGVNGGTTTARRLARFGPGRFRKRAAEILEDLHQQGLVERLPASRPSSASYSISESAERPS
jgi:hypothetical protein